MGCTGTDIEKESIQGNWVKVAVEGVIDCLVAQAAVAVLRQRKNITPVESFWCPVVDHEHCKIGDLLFVPPLALCSNLVMPQ